MLPVQNRNRGYGVSTVLLRVQSSDIRLTALRAPLGCTARGNCTQPEFDVAGDSPPLPCTRCLIFSLAGDRSKVDSGSTPPCGASVCTLIHEAAPSDSEVWRRRAQGCVAEVHLARTAKIDIFIQIRLPVSCVSESICIGTCDGEEDDADELRNGMMRTPFSDLLWRPAMLSRQSRRGAAESHFAIVSNTEADLWV